jgi:hypothetical protein
VSGRVEHESRWSGDSDAPATSPYHCDTIRGVLGSSVDGQVMNRESTAGRAEVPNACGNTITLTEKQK